MTSKDYDLRLYSQACFNVCQACGGDFDAPISCEECLLGEDADMMDCTREYEYQRLKKILSDNPEKLEEILTHC
jgi:hypothetical protein